MSEKLTPHIEEQSTNIDETDGQNDPESRDFILVDTPDQTDEVLRFRASFVNDVRSDNLVLNEIEAVVDFCYHKNRTSIRSNYVYKYLNRSDDLNVNEPKLQSYSQILDRCKDGKYKTNSYGVYIPSYLSELVEYKNDNSSMDHQSLLIGAFTVDSVQEYRATVQSVFDNANCQVIDVEAEHLIKSGMIDVQEMDGLHTSFESSSFDTIHTNYLLHMLEDSSCDEADRTDSIRYLFNEMYRLLKPSGSIIMIEGNLTKIDGLKSPHKCEIVRFLQKAGFRDIKAKSAKEFTDNNSIDKFMRSSAGNFDSISQSEISSYDRIFMFTAKK